jgi:hypothetical protein
MNNPVKPRIFGIGLERTGTTSLAKAVTMLGLKAVHFPYNIRDIVQADFADDLPVTCRFVELDSRFPGSKFILTTREEIAWLASCERWYTYLAASDDNNFLGGYCLKQLYGTAIFDRDAWLQGRRTFEKYVATYFQARPQDLLTLDVCGGQSWDVLLPFIASVFPHSFPRENAFAP